MKTTEKKVIFLDWDELAQLRDYEIPYGKQYLECARDAFLFQCYTSLRYSDVYILRKIDIKKNSIEITTIKTGDSLVIEANDYSRSILTKYKEFHFEQQKALPAISDQKMNDYLKELIALIPLEKREEQSDQLKHIEECIEQLNKVLSNKENEIL